LTHIARSKVFVEAQAKVNLALELLGKRDDGYHEIATLLQGVNLADRILLEERDDGITISSSDPSLPEGPENLAWRAARLVQEARQVSRGVHIMIEKRIPVAAGLGGGSTDAAAVLLGLQRLWGLDGNPEELRAWAMSLGMDVPFFLRGGRVLAEGRGERLTSLPSRPGHHLVLVNPNFPLVTRDVYGWVGFVRPKGTHGLGPLIAALARAVPEQAGYRHAEGNSPGHIKSVLVGTSVTIPIRKGALDLGRWQGVYVAEFDGPRDRSATITCIGDPAR